MPDAQQGETIVVDEDGDLYIACKGGKLLVSRKVLCLASRVFQAMLGHSHFRQSSKPTVANDGIEVRSLEDDDIDILLIIFNITHFKTDELPAQLPSRQAHKLAIISDKYDLRRCLGAYPQQWLGPHMVYVDKPDWEKWLLTSYIFKANEIFTKATRYLIIDSTLSENGTLVSKKAINYGDNIPNTILGLTLCPVNRVLAKWNADKMKSKRAHVVGAILMVYSNMLQRLMRSNQARVCKDTMNQHQCDITNLGCLTTLFQELHMADGGSGICRDSASSITSKIDRIPRFGHALKGNKKNVPFNHLTAYNHIDCDVGPIIKAEMTKLTDALRGVGLPSE